MILTMYSGCLAARYAFSTRILMTILLASSFACHGEVGVPEPPAPKHSSALSVGWRFKVGAPVSQPPVVSHGIIYATSDRGEVIALGMDAVKRWTFTLPQQAEQEHFSTSPLRVANVLLAGTDKGWLYAFNADTGAQQWKVKIGEDIYGTLNWLQPEGTNGLSVLALARNNGSLFRLDLTTGRVIWTSPPTGRSDCSPAAGNGFIVFGACDSALHFLAPKTGEVLAKIGFEEHGPMAGGTTIKGTHVYAGTRDGSVLCADVITYKLLWTNLVAGSEIFTTPAITTDRVIAGSGDGSIYCLNRADGKKIWSVPTQGSPTSPVVSGNTVVVTSGGTLSLLNLDDGKTLWSDKPCDSLTAPAVNAGKIIAGTDDGFIILYQSK